MLQARSARSMLPLVACPIRAGQSRCKIPAIAFLRLDPGTDTESVPLCDSSALESGLCLVLSCLRSGSWLEFPRDVVVGQNAAGVSPPGFGGFDLACQYQCSDMGHR